MPSKGYQKPEEKRFQKFSVTVPPECGAWIQGKVDQGDTASRIVSRAIKFAMENENDIEWLVARAKIDGLTLSEFFQKLRDLDRIAHDYVEPAKAKTLEATAPSSGADALPFSGFGW